MDGALVTPPGFKPGVPLKKGRVGSIPIHFRHISPLSRAGSNPVKYSLTNVKRTRYDNPMYFSIFSLSHPLSLYAA